MDLMSSKSFLLSTAKSMVSTLSGIILWSTGSPHLSPVLMQNPKPFSSLQQDHNNLGLKTLICSEPESTSHHCHSSRVSKPPTPPPPPPKTTPFLPEYGPSHCSAAMDDLIGTDSGVHMVPTSSGTDDDQTTITISDEKVRRCVYSNSRIRDKRRKHREASTECYYPPPIANFVQRRASSWQWTRHCRDGKLVLEGRLLQRREFLEARREDGRLILNLVSTGVDDHDCDDHDFEVINGEDEKQLGGLCLESSKSSGNSTYACGMFMDHSMTLLCNNNVPSTPALVRT